MPGWNCSRCSFRHEFHGTRCAMCNALRVTTAQMKDFIAGGGGSGRGRGSGSRSVNVEKSTPSNNVRKMNGAAAASSAILTVD